MEITIKKTKNTSRRGTVAWLVSKIEKEEITFSEGNVKRTGFHSLFMDVKENGEIVFTEVIASFNPYNFELKDNYTLKYELTDQTLWGKLPATDACRALIDKIGKQWCEEMNEKIEEENVPEVKIVRVEIKE